MAAMTAERAAIVSAEANKLRREGAKALANAKASAGFAAKHARQTALDTAARLASIRAERKRVRRDEAALRFQSLYRGFAVRRTINELRVRKRAHEEFMDLRTYAATKIQATFRGCLSRRLVRAKKVELENFIKFYRAMERDDVLSEYYNQNPVQRFFKNREGAQQEEEAAILRTTIAQARLLDDAEISRRLGQARRKDPIPKFGNLLKTDKDDLGKSKEQISFERAEAADLAKYQQQVRDQEARVAEKARRQAAADRGIHISQVATAMPLSQAVQAEDLAANVAEELDLDRPGRDALFFGIREPKVHLPVGKDRLRSLMQQGYASATARAFAAERSSEFENGLVKKQDLGLDEDDDTFARKQAAAATGGGGGGASTTSRRSRCSLSQFAFVTSEVGSGRGAGWPGWAIEEQRSGLLHWLSRRRSPCTQRGRETSWLRRWCATCKGSVEDVSVTTLPLAVASRHNSLPLARARHLLRYAWRRAVQRSGP